MDIKEINIWIEKNRNGSDLVDHIDNIDWLIAEVEKLENDFRKVNVLNDSIAASVLQETASRCAEIIGQRCLAVNPTESAIKQIKKEFNLEE